MTLTPISSLESARKNFSWTRGTSTGWKITFAHTFAPGAVNANAVNATHLLLRINCKCFKQCLLKDNRGLIRRYFTTLDAILPFSHGSQKWFLNTEYMCFKLSITFHWFALWQMCCIHGMHSRTLCECVGKIFHPVIVSRKWEWNVFGLRRPKWL